MERTPGRFQVMWNGRTSLIHVETASDNPHGAGIPICSVNKKRMADAHFLAAAPIMEEALRAQQKYEDYDNDPDYTNEESIRLYHIAKDLRNLALSECEVR